MTTIQRGRETGLWTSGGRLNHFPLATHKGGGGASEEGWASGGRDRFIIHHDWQYSLSGLIGPQGPDWLSSSWRLDAKSSFYRLKASLTLSHGT